MAFINVPTTITNDIGHGQHLVLLSSNYRPIPDNITISGNSQQEMPDNYVNGAFVYDIGDGFIWIVFWTKNNQVSTKIFIRCNDSTEPNNSILWHQVVNNLHPRLSEDCAFGYTARASIEPNANGQVLTANISRV
ncbi:hypothetical protein ES332_A05G321700v1 [Gossypium tomentosum]|uniref:Uncharacterized protein n=1 Tax=Gossypium tomentosum TaxID=34277 RepID=A0A5C7J0D5_GOSTO|nr:hypothetical protein ES332_1Z024300v1 [Gossypium tomentosum]TYI29519.1 hypothetical protein ES332_A05G321700v1 [Gossypium tomentosum]